MLQTRWITILVAAVTIVAFVGGGAVSQSSSTDDADRPANAEGVNISDLNRSTTAVSDSTADPRLYTVIAESDSAIDTDELSTYGTVGTQFENRVEVRMSASDRSEVANLSWVSAVRPARIAQSSQVARSGNTSSLGVDQLHADGTTGEGVRVGIIDTDFRPDDPFVSDNVADIRAFNDPTGPTHGVEAAQSVVRTAPDAELYLATVSTSTDVVAALDYLESQNVDVVVMPLSFVEFDDDGDHILAEQTAQARAAGSIVIYSAGNQRVRHWQGGFADPNNNQFLNWAENDERQCIPACDRLFRGGTLDIVIDYPRDGDGSDYRAVIFNPDTLTFIADSQRVFVGDDRVVERISVRIPEQAVDLQLRNTAGPADDEIEVNVFGDAATIERPVAASSVTPPADAPASVSVAAYDRAEQRTAFYSSVGPTDDGRQAPTVTGYTNIDTSEGVFTGTSAAAPYVAGVAALVEDAGASDQTPAELETALQATADDIEQPGVDTRSGTGVVNATAAVESVAETPTGITVTPQPAQRTVAPGEAVTISYTVENPTSAASSILVEFPNLPANVTLRSVGTTNVAQDLSASTPPGLISTSVAPSESVTVTPTFAVSSDAPTGDRSVTVEATLSGDGTTRAATNTTTLSVQQQDPLVARFGGDDGEIGNFDVLQAVNAANSGETIGGERVTNLDVLRLVNRLVG